MAALPALLARRFVPHVLAPPVASLLAGSPPFRVFTWNHLAEGLDIHGDFTVDPSVLPWSFRGPRVAEIVVSADADIVCLMEVTDIAMLVRALPGYDLFYAPKPASPAVDKGGPPDGTALLIRRARFAVARAETLHFSFTDSASGITNQVALLCELRDRAVGGRAVVVGAAHLKAKAGPANEAVREGQARQLLAAAKAMQAGRADVPLVLAGDFNESPRRPAYAAMLADPLLLCSAYNALPRPALSGPGAAESDPTAALAAYAAGEPAFTTWKFRGASAAEKKETIDYVWYGPPAARLARLATLALPGEAEVGLAALPSAAWPSDHLALGVDFAWLAEDGAGRPLPEG